MFRREGKHFATLVALAVAVTAPILQAQAPAAADIEPDAIAALKKMGAYLHTLKVFQLRADTYKEEVFVDGQKIQFASSVDLLARSPDRFRARVDSDREDRLYLYDGKSFTLYHPRVNYYATVPAPPTVAELINRLEEKYGMDFPLADLFRWGGPHSSEEQITVASDIGPSEVDGLTCEHYAFRQPGLDWQVWIQLGDYPLPRKLILTTMTDEARPQYSAVYTWNLAPSFNEEAFRFEPPHGAHKIVIAEAPSASREERK